EKGVPGDPGVGSEQTTKDSTQSGASPAGRGGDPSTSAAPPAPAAGARSETKKETTKRDYLPDIGERRSGKVAPEIKRLTVALLYDQALEKKAGFKDDLVKVVKSIVGWDQSRDDKDGFSTLAEEFRPAAPEAGAAAAAGPGMLARALGWARTIGQVLGLLLVLLFLKGLLKQPRARARAAAGAGPAGVEGADTDEGELPPEEQQKRMRREIERAIASDPAALAKMLERWLAETQV